MLLMPAHTHASPKLGVMFSAPGDSGNNSSFQTL